jgi:DNA-binding MarR family transcriptional regulator
VEAVADRLHSAALHLLRRLRAEDDELGISPPRLSALSVVVFGGPLTIGALAEAEGVKPPTMTRLVDGLEREGLVTRESDAADGRAVRVRATADGRRVLSEGRGRRVAALAAGLRRLSDRDVATLRRAAELLERLARPQTPHP